MGVRGKEAGVTFQVLAGMPELLVLPTLRWGSSMHSPHHERTALPCSRFIAHMKNFSESLKFSELHFLHLPAFPERTQNPLAYNTLLCTRGYSFPRSPPVSPASSKEEGCVEDILYSTLFSENSEAPMISAAKKGIKKRARRAPKQAWSSPFLESQMAKKPTRPHSIGPVHLEAAGRHIDRHARLPNQSYCNSEEYPVLYGSSGRPFIAISLCRRSQAPLTLQKASESFSEPELEQKVATPVGALANPDFQSGFLGARGNRVGRCAVTMAPEMLPKHPYFPGKTGPREDASLQGNLAGAPRPRLAGASTRLSSEKLIKFCSSPSSSPLRRFHKACSQAPPWPGVNAHLL
ncbi:uncharacterized protein C12orf42 homolog [Trichechus manatus latirostris]|uniref:Uncharacterized protein C12orf42 homolog n=1 Tax=Trichechus manatus latirostris TaxID=127582 RepID=A0A2Y9FVS5_TRIMA|nr:uncharacterized protein C12orf42 homolog [Trichechus manatus latirostris]